MKPFTQLLFALALSACGSPAHESGIKPPAADSAQHRFNTLMPRLVGEWSDPDTEPGAVAYERWQRADDGTALGMGFVMVEKDTVFIEHLRIAPDSARRLAYHVRVPSQNGGDAIAFALTACAGDSMVFENPAHDFPRRISYALQPDGAWIARVSGPGKAGGWRVLRYRFKRVE